MPGFVGYISLQKKTDVELHMQNILDLKFDEIQTNHYCIRYYSNNKFDKDKIFREDDKVIIGFDGYLLNSSKLQTQHNSTNNFLLFKKLYELYGINFVKELRGSFSGFIFDKQTENWHIYTDHISTKPLFYYFNQKQFIFSSSLKSITEILKQLGQRICLSELGAYYMLTFGFMLGDETLIQEIKKVPAGTILTKKNAQLKEFSYYALKNTAYVSDKKQDIIENLDVLFTEALKLEYEKDREAGYSHIATLSGGLDSRMNVFYAVKNGFRDIQAFCFSQSKYLDEFIARKVSNYLAIDFLFFPLDGGDYLNELDDVLVANDGLILYSGSAHDLNTIKKLDFSNRGMIHTGQIGDLVLGSYLKDKMHHPVSPSIIKHTSYSSTLLNKIPPSISTELTNKYANGELFSFYERCINGAYNGNFMGYQFTEVSSPFLYIEFLDYAINIHPKFRCLQKIYLEWIAKKNKEMAKFKWEKWNRKPTLMNFNLRPYYRIYQRRLRNFNIRRGKGLYSMNPFEHWYSTNPSLPAFFNKNLKDNIETLDAFPLLKQDTLELFNKGTVLEKTQVLTLINAIKFLS